MLWSLILALATVASGQQIYLHTTGPSARPYCTATSVMSTAPGPTAPSYHFGSFSYTQTETVRTATSAVSSALPTYGLNYSVAKQFFANLSTTSWGNWEPKASGTATDTKDPYGQAAFSSLWMREGNFQNLTRGLYSTTVSPTPVPTSELVLPPPLYFGPQDCYSFPSDFILGVAGAAAQIEGAVADEGRSPAIPDFLVELAESISAVGIGITNVDNDFTATENYYLYKQDIERLASMGMKYYSFSIAWTRILPFALPGTPLNSQGLEHYDELINFTIEKGMQPVVTLTHFDAPAVFIGGSVQGLLERTFFGSLNYGYQNETFEDAFVNYGKIVMAHFADRVPIWLTFNEPQVGCISGPSVDHIIKSHARLYHFYKEELQGKGLVSVKIGAVPGIPQDPSNASHVAAAQHYTNFNIGTFLYPLALGQDYPDSFKMAIQDYVPLSPQDLDFLNGTLDFVAVDAYSAASISPIVDITSCSANNATFNTDYPLCVGVSEVTLSNWIMGYHQDYITYNTAPYLRTQLNYLWNTFRAPVMITEFGFSTSNPSQTMPLSDLRFDIERSEYYLSYLTEVLKSIWEDGVNIKGVLMWSFVDNWEWGTYEHYFGLQYVNRTTQERTYKRSFFDVVDFVESRRMTR
ncbi:glycoside hydrolase family 1 protein [Leptodontidium sp. 2 PMI_412]|nr:glycoside hydrolase family 1 protein [Leptodontidium sp. 2 PMI_412]